MSSLVIKPFKLENKVNSAFLSSNSITVHRQYLPIQNNAWTISYCKEGVIGPDSHFCYNSQSTFAKFKIYKDAHRLKMQLQRLIFNDTQIRQRTNKLIQTIL